MKEGPYDAAQPNHWSCTVDIGLFLKSIPLCYSFSIFEGKSTPVAISCRMSQLKPLRHASFEALSAATDEIKSTLRLKTAPAVLKFPASFPQHSRHRAYNTIVTWLDKAITAEKQGNLEDVYTLYSYMVIVYTEASASPLSKDKARQLNLLSPHAQTNKELVRAIASARKVCEVAIEKLEKLAPTLKEALVFGFAYSL